MRKFVIALAFAFGAFGFARSAMLETGGALAETPTSQSIYEGLKQAALTEARITQYLAARKDVEAVFADAPADSADKPDPAIAARLEAAARKHQFASYDDFDAVAGNIALVRRSRCEHEKICRPRSGAETDDGGCRGGRQSIGGGQEADARRIDRRTRERRSAPNSPGISRWSSGVMTNWPGQSRKTSNPHPLRTCIRPAVRNS